MTELEIKLEKAENEYFSKTIAVSKELSNLVKLRKEVEDEKSKLNSKSDSAKH